MEYAYGSVSVGKLDKKFNDIFEATADDEKFMTKQVYTHSEPGLSFKYRYVYQEVYMAGYEDKPTDAVCTCLYMVMEPKSLCKSRREQVVRDAGIKDATIDDMNVIDVMDSGIGSVLVAKKTTTEKEADKLRDVVANVLIGYDGLRGFYLDGYQNLIGTTGWDVLKEAKGKIKDALTYSLKKSMAQMKK